jgi:O-antigen/teichoic acid export membrane protein
VSESLALARRLGLSAGSKLAAELSGRALQFGLAYVAQRTLGQAGYGEFTYWVDVSFVVAALSDLGLQLTVTREMARDEGAAPRPAGAGLALKVILAVPAALVLLAVALLRPPAVPAATAALGLAMLFNTFVDYLGYTFRGVQRVEVEAALTLVLRVLVCVLGLAALAGGLGLPGLAGAYALGGAAAAALGYVWFGRLVRARAPGAPALFRPDWAYWRALLREALPLGGAIVLSILYTRTAVFLLDALYGVEAVGAYGVARKFVEPLSIVPAALLAAVFPAYAGALARRGAEAAWLRHRTLALLAAAGTGVALAGWLGGPWLIAALYQGDYADAVPVLQVLALSALPAFINYALTHFLVARGRQKLNLWFNAVILVLNAALCVALVPRLGPPGAAWATLASECTLFGLCWWALRSD